MTFIISKTRPVYNTQFPFIIEDREDDNNTDNTIPIIVRENPIRVIRKVLKENIF